MHYWFYSKTIYLESFYVPEPGLGTDKAGGARTDTLPVLVHQLVEHNTTTIQPCDLVLITFKN